MLKPNAKHKKLDFINGAFEGKKTLDCLFVFVLLSNSGNDTAEFQLNNYVLRLHIMLQQFVVNEWLCASFIFPPTFFYKKSKINQLIVHTA